MRDRMMVCSAAASCAKKCDGKTEHPFSEACCRIACRDQGQAVGCVPVAPEVAEPEMMQCPGWPTCAADSCRGHRGVHERRAECSHDGCNHSHEAGPCVPVAAKPKPELQTDADLLTMVEAKDELRKARAARAHSRTALGAANATYARDDKAVARCVTAVDTLYTKWRGKASD